MNVSRETSTVQKKNSRKMKYIPNEEEIRKKAVFSGMSPKRQKQILNKGYEKWDPFTPPKDPIDLKGGMLEKNTYELIREFFQSRSTECYGKEYGKGALDICLGIMNKEERFLGMFDFICWYQDRLRREDHTKQK